MENLTLDYQICNHKSALEQFAIKFTHNQEDADDLVQDTLLRAMRYADLYQNGTNLQGWLYTIMKNTFINDYRKSSIRKKVINTVEVIDSQQLTQSAATNEGVQKFLGEDIDTAIKNLSPTYSVPFLKYFEGYKYHEIADELNIPIGTVKTRIYMARQSLQASLKMYSDDFNKKRNCN